MTKVLFVGNSFSTDATRYIESIADGELFVRNLYIGGCSLQTHDANICSDEQCYEYQKDAELLYNSSLKAGLLAEDWDIISVQQVSSESGIIESYEPYMGRLVAFIRELVPAAKIVFHRTWAYERDSEHPGFAAYGNDTAAMHAAIISATTAAAEKYGFEIIRSGDAVAKARTLAAFDVDRGGIKITRDGFHLSLDYGRYLAGLMVYRALTGKTAAGVRFAPEGTDGAIIAELKAVADSV